MYRVKIKPKTTKKRTVRVWTGSTSTKEQYYYNICYTLYTKRYPFTLVIIVNNQNFMK